MLTYLPSISLLQVRGARPTQPYVVGPVAVKRHQSQLNARSVVAASDAVVAPAALFAIQSRLYALSVVAPTAVALY